MIMKSIVEVSKSRRAEFDGYKEKAIKADALVAEIEKEKGNLSPSLVVFVNEYAKLVKPNK